MAKSTETARATNVLLWLLRRMKAAENLPEDVDLILVHDDALLSMLDPSLDIGMAHLRVGRFTGELTLRSGLPDADRLVAVVPRGFRPPLDILERARARHQTRPHLDVPRLRGRRADLASVCLHARLEEGRARGVSRRPQDRNPAV